MSGDTYNINTKVKRLKHHLLFIVILPNDTLTSSTTAHDN